MKVDVIDAKTGVVKSVRQDIARVLVKLKKARFAERPPRAPEPTTTHQVESPTPYETRSVKSTQTKGKRGQSAQTK